MEKRLLALENKLDYLVKLIENHILCDTNTSVDPIKDAVDILDKLGLPPNPVVDALKKHLQGNKQ